MEVRQLKEKKSYMVNSVQDSRNKNKVLMELQNAQKRGLLHGIYGRLGDLGSIDQAYDVAISSCCPQLDYIVVESIKDAEQALNYLRENNIGKATFIGLDKT